MRLCYQPCILFILLTKCSVHSSLYQIQTIFQHAEYEVKFSRLIHRCLHRAGSRLHFSIQSNIPPNMQPKVFFSLCTHHANYLISRKQSTGRVPRSMSLGYAIVYQQYNERYYPSMLPNMWAPPLLGRCTQKSNLYYASSISSSTIAARSFSRADESEPNDEILSIQWCKKLNHRSVLQQRQSTICSHRESIWEIIRNYEIGEGDERERWNGMYRD